jgi:hypothetical protein
MVIFISQHVVGINAVSSNGLARSEPKKFFSSKQWTTDSTVQINGLRREFSSGQISEQLVFSHKCRAL